MERSMKRLEMIGEKNDAKKILKKVDVNEYRQAFNDAIDKAWDAGVKMAALHMGTKDNEFVSEMYWINTPMAHTISTTEKKIAKLLKDFPNSDYLMLSDDATALLNEFKPYAEKAQGYKEQLANQVIAPKESKDPVESLPPASRSAMLKVIKILRDRCNDLQSELEFSYKAGLENVLNQYLSRPLKERMKSFHQLYRDKPEYIPLLRSMTALTRDENGQEAHIKSVNADSYILKTAAQSAKDTVDTYVFKHSEKLAFIIENMPNISNIELNAYSNNGKIEGDLALSFDEGCSFRVHSQIVLVENSNGLLFARYPTTFHDVTNQNGSIEGKMLSESEMRDWSQGRSLGPSMDY